MRLNAELRRKNKAMEEEKKEEKKEEKRQSLFRKKSQEYIDSPEKLDNYLHVTSPGVWALLLAVIVLLIGSCVWGMTGRLETHITVAVIAEDGKCSAYVPESAIDAVVKFRDITVEDEKLTLEPDALEPIAVTDSTNIYVRLAGNLNVGDIVYQIPIAEEMEDLDDGIYSGTVTTETISPAALLLN